MEEPLQYRIHPKENLYFTIKVILSIPIYGLLFYGLYALFTTDKSLVAFIPLIIYAILILIYVFLAKGILVGHIKGNAVRLSEKQFPEVYQILVKQCEQLDMEIPPVYVMQHGGVLNAFATRFIGKNYVLIYSEIFDMALEGGVDELSFVMAHELGHIKRNHIIKRFWLFPSLFIPFIGSAYSRACEYTCDNIGDALSPDGSKAGLLVLASGKTCHKSVNVQEYLDNANTETGFWKWFAEKVSSHPNLPKRIENISR
ncbi:MAG TPA: M48 family metallopeptidase [Pelobium sp.]|nr:M48 family metallopeptidase [Pelobium sp.]